MCVRMTPQLSNDMDMTDRIFVTATILQFIWIFFLILDADAQLTVHTPTDLSVREGDNVTLVCTYEPRTEPVYFGVVAWQMGDTVLASYLCVNACSRTNANPDRYTLDADTSFSGNLTISDITLEDDNVYQCAVTTLHGNSDSHTRLAVNVPPLNLKLSDTMTLGGHEQGDIVPVLSGQSYSLTCSTQPGANPPADLEWTSTTAQISQGVKDDQPVTGIKMTMSSREVTFTPTMVDHMTSVTCEAIHPALDTSLTKFIQLDVQVPPSNVNIAFNSAMISDGETLTLQEGTPSTITCKGLGTRPASAITWYLNGVQVTSGISKPVFSRNAGDSRLSDVSSSIVIQPTRENHEQVLRCQAETFGISQDTSIRLSIDGPPDPPVITGIPDILIENQQTSVSCRAQNGHPSPSFQWFIGNRNLTGDATLLVSADVSNRIDATSQLRYLPLREDNGRALLCNVIHDALSQPLKVMSDALTVNYLESRKKLAPALISVAFIVILLILIFVIIGWRLSRKNKQARKQSQSPKGKNMNISDPSSSIKEDKPYAELSNTGMKTQEHDYMPLNTYETMELADRSPPNKEDKPYAELSNTGMKTQEHDYMPLNTYETPMELADRSPPGAPDSTLGGGATARTNLEHTYANAEEKGSREDSRENDYINNTVLIPRVI